MELIAKKFLSVLDLVEMGYTIPTGVQLVDAHGTDKGSYLGHVKDDNQDYHTLQNYRFRSTPFPIHEIGIMIEVPFPLITIDRHMVVKNNVNQN